MERCGLRPPVPAVSRFDGKTWTSYTAKDGLPESGVSGLAVGTDGVVWCGSYGSGVMQFDGKAWTNFTAKDGLISDNVRTISADTEGTIWFGAYAMGVTGYDGKTWTSYAVTPSLGGNEDPGAGGGWQGRRVVCPRQ